MRAPRQCGSKGKAENDDTDFVFHELRVILRDMKNVTITMDDGVADWARMEAARRNTSVSKLVGELVAEKMRSEATYERAMREALKFKSFGKSSGPYLTRDEIYAERLDRFR